MDYRLQLKAQLERRREINPRYSLRAFAKKLGLSPSKLSEVMARKRNLSAARAALVADRLGLLPSEREAFLLTVDLDAAEGPRKKQIKDRLKEIEARSASTKTTQRNAWYFGAVQALDGAGHDAQAFAPWLGLTSLQIENARRYRDRMRRFFPERDALSYEPVSLLKCLSDGHIGQAASPLEADFVYLDDAAASKLADGIRRLVRELAVPATDQPPAGDLRMVHWGFVQLAPDREFRQ